MKIENSVALVTGANRGIGRHLAQQLLQRGAAKVYAAARDPEVGDVPGASRLRLDITDPDSVAAAAVAASDVTLLVNNAGINTRTELITGDMATIRREMETNFFGTLNVTRAFAPVLRAHGGGAVLNMLSAMAWFAYPGAGAYAAAKSAAWNLTNAARVELAPQGTLVVAVHLGIADTAMSEGLDADKLDPADVARSALDGLEAGLPEVLVDAFSAQVKAALAGDTSAGGS